MGMPANAEQMRQTIAKWKERVRVDSYEQLKPVFLAQDQALRAAVLQAQGLRRGMKQRFGFDLKSGQFLSVDHKKRIKTYDELLAFSLHLYTFQVAREMTVVAREYVQWLAAGKIVHCDNALDGLVAVRLKLMEGFPPYLIFVTKKGQNDPAAAIDVLTSYVRSGLSRTVRSGRGKGTEMDWARGVRLAHPGALFEEALHEELPAEVSAALLKIDQPHKLYLLRSKVSEALRSQLITGEDHWRQAARRAKDPVPTRIDIDTVQINPMAECEAREALLQQAKSLLTPSEWEVMLFALDGHSSAEIAKRLNKSEQTVSNQRTSYKKKLKNLSREMLQK